MGRIDDIAGKRPFRVPANYFDDVTRRILSATADKEAVPPLRKKSFRINHFLAAAAAIALLAVLSYVTVKMFSREETRSFVTGITIEEFSETYLNEIDILSLEESAEPLLFTGEPPDVSETDIVDYLTLENIDISEIYELL